VILVDTSVCINHLRRGDARLSALLDSGLVLTHPFVIGELACGNLENRAVILTLLDRLTRATSPTDREVLKFVEQQRLMGRGIGYIDAHLLASARLTPAAKLWTRDTRLAALAGELSVLH
jgi:predicted nucleic acid-binding protein